MKIELLLFAHDGFNPILFFLILLQMLFVCVNVPDQEDSGEEALQDLSLQGRGAEPQRAVEVTGRIQLNVEDVMAIAQ